MTIVGGADNGTDGSRSDGDDTAESPLIRPIREGQESSEDGSNSGSSSKHEQTAPSSAVTVTERTASSSAVQVASEAKNEVTARSWDDIGRRLVEARKALDIASKADQTAGEELAEAQRKKNETALELKKRTAIVTRLAMEFTGVSMGGEASADPPKLHMLAPRAPPMMMSSSSSSSSSSSWDHFRAKSQAQTTSASEFNPYVSQRINRPTPSGSTFAANLLRLTRPTESAEGISSAGSGFQGGRESGNGSSEEQERKRIKVTVRHPDPEYSVGMDDPARMVNFAAAAKKKNSYGRSLFRGVRKVLSDGTFEARISVNGQDLLLGRFPDEEDAAKAYDLAVRKHRSPKDKAAVLNFPSEEDREQGWRSTFEQT